MSSLRPQHLTNIERYWKAISSSFSLLFDCHDFSGVSLSFEKSLKVVYSIYVIVEGHPNTFKDEFYMRTCKMLIMQVLLTYQVPFI